MAEYYNATRERKYCLIVDCFAFAEPAAMSRHFKTADRDPVGHIIVPAQEQLRSGARIRKAE